jgi:alkylation response protein AidB-like acyl-CoA dehydrogenase
MTIWLDEELGEVADALDSGPPAFDLLGRLAAEGLTRVGVPAALGGDGGAPSDVAAAVAAVARHSVAAAFVLWSQRSYAATTRRCVRGSCPRCWRAAGPAAWACRTR